LAPPFFLGWGANYAISMENPGARSVYTSVINQRSFFYYEDTNGHVRIRALNAFTGQQVWDADLGPGRISYGSVVGVSGTDRVYFIYDSKVLRSSTGLPTDSDP